VARFPRCSRSAGSPGVGAAVQLEPEAIWKTEAETDERASARMVANRNNEISLAWECANHRRIDSSPEELLGAGMEERVFAAGYAAYWKDNICPRPGR
jgi:hypothetical protein